MRMIDTDTTTSNITDAADTGNNTVTEAKPPRKTKKTKAAAEGEAGEAAADKPSPAPRKRKAAAADEAAAKGKARKAKGGGKAAKAAKAGKRKAAAGNGDGRLALDETRKDKVAASLRIRAGTPRAIIVEALAAKGGALISGETLGKRAGVDWSTKQVGAFITTRIPYKSNKYALNYEVINDGKGNYGLKVR